MNIMRLNKLLFGGKASEFPICKLLFKASARTRFNTYIITNLSSTTSVESAQPNKSRATTDGYMYPLSPLEHPIYPEER
jgi:hypothetical protein